MNDAQGGLYGALLILEGIGTSIFYNNTIITGYAITPGRRPIKAAVDIRDGQVGKDGVKFYHNIIQTHNRIPAVVAGIYYLPIDFHFLQNDYYASNWAPSGMDPLFRWGGSPYRDLGAWRETGQEPVPYGLPDDPQLNGPITNEARNINNPDLLYTLAEYQLQAGSGLRDQGLFGAGLPWDPYGFDHNLWIAPYFPNTRRDFYGTSLPRGADYDIGAHEFCTGPGLCTTGPGVSSLFDVYADTVPDGFLPTLLPRTMGGEVRTEPVQVLDPANDPRNAVHNGDVLRAPEYPLHFSGRHMEAVVVMFSDLYDPDWNLDSLDMSNPVVAPDFGSGL